MYEPTGTYIIRKQQCRKDWVRDRRGASPTAPQSRPARSCGSCSSRARRTGAASPAVHDSPKRCRHGLRRHELRRAEQGARKTAPDSQLRLRAGGSPPGARRQVGLPPRPQAQPQVAGLQAPAQVLLAVVQRPRRPRAVGQRAPGGAGRGARGLAKGAQTSGARTGHVQCPPGPPPALACASPPCKELSRGCGRLFAGPASEALPHAGKAGGALCLRYKWLSSPCSQCGQIRVLGAVQQCARRRSSCCGAACSRAP